MAPLHSSLASRAPRAALPLEKKQQQQKQKRALPSSSSPALSPPSSPLTSTKKPLSSLRVPRRLAALRPPAASNDKDENKKSTRREREEDEADLLLGREFPRLAPPPSSPPPLVKVLSRDAERTVGRTAMLSFACAVAGEVLAGGGGPLSQLRLLGDAGLLPRFALDALLAGACASGLLFALSPISRTWNDSAVREALLSSSRSPVSKPAPASSASSEAKAAMIEVLAGRLALVGLLFLVVVERQTGGAGALEQLGLRLPASSSSYAGAAGDARAFLLWLAFAALAWATRFRSGGGGGGEGGKKPRR